MCNVDCFVFTIKNLNKIDIEGKKIIEVGSYNVNGSLRLFVEKFNPAEYIGVDIDEGNGVDLVCNAENIVDKFGKESFDIVIATELLEHVVDWQKIISNFKNILKKDGLIIITTRSIGFPYHPYPLDIWRYELEDMQNIFSDFEILNLEKDTSAPGIFIKCKKPKKFIENDLSDYKLYSIVKGKRINKIAKKDFKTMHFRFICLKQNLFKMFVKIKRLLSKLLRIT